MNRNTTCLLSTLVACLVLAGGCAPHVRSAESDPCNPNPCEQDHKTTCSDDGSGQAVCSCDPGYQERDMRCIRQIPAGRELTSGAASVQGGGYRMDVQIGHPMSQAPSGDGTTRIEGASVVKK